MKGSKFLFINEGIKIIKMLTKVLPYTLVLVSFVAHAGLRLTGPASPATADFPVFYQDGNGLELDLCLPSPGDELKSGLCLLTPSDIPNPNKAIILPSNFPEEAFWWQGSSSLTLENGEEATLTLALEAAFSNDSPTPGKQIAFARFRFRLDAPQPGDYEVTHPYGTKIFHVDAGMPRFRFTDDVGSNCGTSFTCAANGGIGPFLRPSQNTTLGGGSPKPPIEKTVNGRLRQYIADPAVKTSVTGGINNFFRIRKLTANGATEWEKETRLFSLMGRINNGSIAGTAPTPKVEFVPLGPKLTDPIQNVIEKGKAKVSLVPVAKGLINPVTATFAPNDKKHLYVAEQNGKIWSVSLNGNKGKGSGRTLFADLGADGLNLGCFGSNYDERGLLGLAFHPDYPKNGLVYTFQSQPHTGAAALPTNACNSAYPDHDNVITEWQVTKVAGKRAKIDVIGGRQVLRLEHPQFNHNAGELRFGPDAMLYIALGDGGNADDQGIGHTTPGGNAQDLSNLYGKILRIDPQAGAALAGYKIPDDNPFVNTPGARGEIWAYGFRNPYRMSFDNKTGQLYVGDVGQNGVEEIDVVAKGLNYGWPVKEGSFAFNLNGPGSDGYVTADKVPGAFVDPIAQFDHCIPNQDGQCQTNEGIAVVGGFVYHGKEIKKLRGRYIFGAYATDFASSSGRLFYLDEQNQVREFQLTGKQNLGLSVLGFGQDTRGEAYLLGKSGASQTNTGITDVANKSGVVLKLTGDKQGSSGKGSSKGNNK